MIRVVAKVKTGRFSSRVCRWLLALCAGFAASACSTIEDDSANAWIATVELHNPAASARHSQPVYLPFYDLGLLSGTTEQPLVSVVDDAVVPSEQVDRDGDGIKDGLLVLLDFAGGESRRLQVRYRTDRYRPVRADDRVQAELAIKQGGRWLEPEADAAAVYQGGKYKDVDTATPPDQHSQASSWVRNDGPGLEAERLGYRFFLDERGGYAVYAKPDAQPALHTADFEDAYRRDGEPLGQKLFQLDGALGAGGFGYWRSGELKGLRQLDSRTATVLDDGRLRASLRFDYYGWHLTETRLDAQALVSVSAGSELLHNQLSLSGDLPNLAVSLGQRDGATLIEPPASAAPGAYTYFATWGPSAITGEPLGIAIFVRQRDLLRREGDAREPVVVLKPTRGRVAYHLATVAAATGEDAARDNEDTFRTYLEATAARLSQPLYTTWDTALSRTKTAEPLSAEHALYWARAMADSELVRNAGQYRAGGWDPRRMREPGFDYDTAGMLPLALDELAKTTGEERFSTYKSTVTASYIRPDGSIAHYRPEDFDLGNIAPGRVLARLASQSDEPRFDRALARLREQLAHQPRVGAGGYAQHARIAQQFWLAGLYMAMPFVATDGTEGDPLAPFEVARTHLREPASGLYHSAWDAQRTAVWADPETGQSGHLRARDMGLLAMALVDVVAVLGPEADTPVRLKLREMIVELARALREQRDPERHVWWQGLARQGEPGNYPESSATAMFTYFLAKAINLGLLDDAAFGEDATVFARASFQALTEQFVVLHPDGKLSLTLQAAGLGPPSEHLYGDDARVTNAASGTAAFILAALEVHRLLARPAAPAGGR